MLFDDVLFDFIYPLKTGKTLILKNCANVQVYEKRNNGSASYVWVQNYSVSMKKIEYQLDDWIKYYQQFYENSYFIVYEFVRKSNNVPVKSIDNSTIMDDSSSDGIHNVHVFFKGEKLYTINGVLGYLCSRVTCTIMDGFIYRKETINNFEYCIFISGKEYSYGISKEPLFADFCKEREKLIIDYFKKIHFNYKEKTVKVYVHNDMSKAGQVVTHALKEKSLKVEKINVPDEDGNENYLIEVPFDFELISILLYAPSINGLSIEKYWAAKLWQMEPFINDDLDFKFTNGSGVDKNIKLFLKEYPTSQYQVQMLTELLKEYHPEKVTKYHQELGDNFFSILGKKIYTNVYDSMLLNGRYIEKPTVWVSEKKMFNLIKKRFPDAVFQFHSYWLGLQSYDTYIPSLKVAFEYQGIQHYQPVEIFGGLDGFNQTVARDNIKRKKSIDNGITQIDWKYDEDITESVLFDKLKKYNLI